MVSKEVNLPTYDELTVDELKLSTSTLMTAGPHLGKACESVNNEFMLCRQEFNDPRPCLELGRRVTACTWEFFKRVKANCEHEFNQFANCVDKSSGDFRYKSCRKTQTAFADCMDSKLCIKPPHFGYFTRARVHSSPSQAPEGPPCPCHPVVPDATPSLPDCKPRPPARFGGRLYWVTE
ncbi:NADH dehydrogenase [ubiquinone] 1 alpha subcomplex subunit 8-like [Plodia interpunctella]|uniref:NADH dehydrogenase [ubiquinone] 1 alpha subcomplex subunit 8-like n=1 Tax=Plodia interpunctella TaxID=58824 RepID=UPI002368C0F2|nr:NADH dehydrogenase [ubiquinone] 1 alpha subcomplex subunit 8-like [Plodia interpunctella]